MFDPSDYEAEPTQFGDSLARYSCGVCNLAFGINSHTQAKVAVYRHIVRVHPEVYEQVVGHPPREEEVRATTYALLEGLISMTEVG